MGNDGPPSDAAERPRRGRRRLWVAGAAMAMLVGLAGGVAWLLRGDNAGDADPRVNYPSPYRNVRPGVAYVGQHRCAECHPAETAAFRQHPMGNSIGRVADYPAIERYDANNPFQAFGFEYAIHKSGASVSHIERKLTAQGEVVFEHKVEVQFAVGSGHSNRGYLIQREGFLFASAISWFPQKQRWGLSPGYEKSPQHPHFERVIDKDCLFCHVDRVEPLPHRSHQFKEPVQLQPIGCERCHGPGGIHVEDPTADSIVNPKRLAPALRDAVCEQCHALAEVDVSPLGRDLLEYRPGLPWHLFHASFMLVPEARAVNPFGDRVEQMRASACYEKSDGAFTCISCHDPHRVPSADEKVGFYRDRCLACHGVGRTACSLPLAQRGKEDDCAGCHMPSNSTDFAHISLTEHRVQRPGQPRPRPEPSSGPLVHLHQHLLKPGEGQRELSIALIHLASQGRYPETVHGAASFLETYVKKQAGDLDALDALAMSHLLRQMPQAALSGFDAVLSKDADRDHTLINAAVAASQLGRDNQAIDYAERAARLNPYSSKHQLTVGSLRMKAGQWPEAVDAARRAIAVNPASVDARRILFLAQLRQGNRDAAKQAWQTLAAFDPPDKEELRRLLD